ncbi:MAG: UvrB/UvrC motif-containing protein, partial [Acidimicrobiia bacterium]|nr:UvrB/UvrC motif-containing protein [Acidimicrobiia bacterium]
GQVVMYADVVTDSMRRAIDETSRRRARQQAHNTEHGISPQTIRKAVTDILALIRPEETAPVPQRQRHERRGPRGVVGAGAEGLDVSSDDLPRLIAALTEEMQEASADLRFEYAARLRDEINELRREQRDIAGAHAVGA